ncbi:hypothetical protein PAUR_a1455 [Pseudoalteromonas aurantia 208]|uniref:Uncharacterized protein n=1 Tax=Pseudoalteromonas aurantia 208 TaxID=1314867 RepID=A0ABR9EC96_9GAMM|nr:hypothetical protein [Pseudoalteromonas aurantia 208]
MFYFIFSQNQPHMHDLYVNQPKIDVFLAPAVKIINSDKLFFH